MEIPRCVVDHVLNLRVNCVHYVLIAIADRAEDGGGVGIDRGIWR